MTAEMPQELVDAAVTRQELLENIATERERQISWRLMIRETAAELMRDPDGPCFPGTNEFLEENGIPVLQSRNRRQDITADDGLAAARAQVEQQVPAVNPDFYTEAGLRAQLPLLQASGAIWLEDIIDKLDNLDPDDVPELVVEQLMRRLRGTPEPTAEEVAAATPQPFRFALRVEGTIVIPATYIPPAASNAMIQEQAEALLRDSLLRDVQAYAGAQVRELNVTVAVTRD
jgi:hypothetical protein